MEERERLNRMHELYNEFVASMNGWWTNTEYVHRLKSEERDICDDFILGYLCLHLNQPDKGIEMLKKSAEEGNDFAALTLAEEYLKGALLPANVKKAECWYNRYLEMPICKYVLDRIREYNVNGDTKTIYQISCCDVDDSFTSHIFKDWDMPNLGDLKDGEVGIKLFKHLFDMIQWKVDSSSLFKYDEGCFSKRTNSVKDVDFIHDIEEISNAIISYCKVMKPILEDRDWYIYAIENENDGIKARWKGDKLNLAHPD